MSNGLPKDNTLVSRAFPFTNFVPKYGKLGQGFKKWEIIDSFAHPGRRTTAKGYQSPATWITELADTRKAILLCSLCDRKFDASSFKYLLRYTRDPSGITNGSVCNGMCDACKQPTADLGQGKLWVAAELWDSVSTNPQQARINQRMAWKPKKRFSLREFIRRFQHGQMCR